MFYNTDNRIQNLTPQLINAGTIKINYPENKAAEENFENLRKQYADGMQVEMFLRRHRRSGKIC